MGFMLLTCGVLFVVSTFVTLMMTVVNSPLLLLGGFLVLVCVSVLNLYLFVGDFLSMVMFLVYIGGLLVLLTYMLVMSSNTMGKVNNYHLSWCMCLSMLMSLSSLFRGGSETIVEPGRVGGTLGVDYSCLVVLSCVLFFVFIFICNIVSVGGRTLNIGKNS